MNNIKSFIYLDNQKMYSLASQLFEGLIESYIESELTEDNKSENQKGPIGSGNYLADLMRLQKNRTENKFLHDYLYTRFENELISKEKLLDIDDSFEGNINPYQLVKIRGRIIINDAEEIIKTIKEFNNLGDAISYMTLFSQKQELEEQAKIQAEEIKDRNQKVRAIQKNSSSIKNSIKQHAKDNGLNLDKEFLDKLEYALKFGLDDMLEIQMEINGTKFSSVLDRSFLKEKEQNLVYKFSRQSEKEVSLLGIVTQGNSYEIKSKDDDDRDPSFKEAFRNMVDKLIDVENVFIGKSIGEVIVDPIALYIEL